MRNKRGQTLGVAIIISIFIFIVGMLTINIIKPEVTTARSPEVLDCANNSITDGNKMACLAVDVVVPYFIIIVLSIAGGIITARLML